jgi:hypothetical protein
MVDGGQGFPTALPEASDLPPLDPAVEAGEIRLEEANNNDSQNIF